MTEVKQKRPDGITAIAILWFFGGLYNVYVSFQTMSQDVSALPYLSDSAVNPWFSFGLPTEIAINLLSLFLGLLQIVTVFGLWTGKKYSYRLALLVPIILVIGYVCSIALYASAPTELGLLSGAGMLVIGLIMGVFWLGVYWKYIDKPHVKAFLGVVEAQPLPLSPPRTESQGIPNPERNYMSKPESVLYCRYCGTENKADAIFCRKCGKNIE